MSPSTSSASSADEENAGPNSKSRAQKADKGLGDCVPLDKDKIGDFRFRPTVTMHNSGEDREPSASSISGKKNENVFSFKKFLQSSDNQANYQVTGARPKVYDGRTKPPELHKNHESGMYSRNPTELPDFVQDHLVLEQCFLNEGVAGPKQDNIEWGHLPDFALNSIEKSQRWNPETTNHIKEEQDCLWRNLSRPTTGTSNPFNSHSPLPGPSSAPLDREFLPRPGPSSIGVDVTQNSSTGTDAPKLLPDFLTNAPLRRESPLTGGQDYLSDSTTYTAMENERLKSELEVLRRQTNKHLARITELEAELLRMEQEALAGREFLDDQLHGTKKAHDCDQEVTSLKIMVESLNLECNRLRTENRELKLATGCLNCKDIDPAIDRRMFGLERRVAEDLRIIATTTEVSLRQLLTGVNNMRALAIALDNMERIEDASKAKDFLPESDDDNAAGPAL